MSRRSFSRVGWTLSGAGALLLGIITTEHRLLTVIGFMLVGGGGWMHGFATEEG